MRVAIPNQLFTTIRRMVLGGLILFPLAAPGSGRETGGHETAFPIPRPGDLTASRHGGSASTPPGADFADVELDPATLGRPKGPGRASRGRFRKADARTRFDLGEIAATPDDEFEARFSVLAAVSRPTAQFGYESVEGGADSRGTRHRVLYLLLNTLENTTLELSSLIFREDAVCRVMRDLVLGPWNESIAPWHRIDAECEPTEGRATAATRLSWRITISRRNP